MAIPILIKLGTVITYSTDYHLKTLECDILLNREPGPPGTAQVFF